MDFDLPEEPAAPVQAASGGIEAVTAATLESIGGWPAILGRVLSRQDLTADEASAALDDVLEGNATVAQIAAFIAGLRTKGETVGEMTGLVRALRAHGESLEVGVEVVDTCGTGGDRSGTVLAGCDVASTRRGSASALRPAFIRRCASRRRCVVSSA